MSVLTAILLGLLQGVTVFLPISYSGHKALFHNLLKLDTASDGLMGFLMNASTFVSILLVYKNDIGRMLKECADFLKGKTYEDPLNEGRMAPPLRVLFFIIIGTAPLLLTTPISKRTDVLMDKTVFVGICMAAMGAVLCIADKFVKAGKKKEKTMTVKDALYIGLGQALAVIPGLSRTGITVAMGMTRGLKRDFSVRFSILLSLPSVVLSVIVSFFALFKSTVDWSQIWGCLAAFVISVLTGYVSIQTLRILLKKKKLRYFSYYLWVVGAAAVILSLTLKL